MEDHAEHTSDQPRSVSVDYRGLGQSGYTAGRREDDAALQRVLETQNVSYPRGVDADEAPPGLGTDDRFTGRRR
jgi:hypothetical protein